MTEPLRVTVNRDGPNTIDAPSFHEAAGSFSIALANAGAATHVHITLEESLEGAARLREDQVYLDRDDRAELEVTVRGPNTPASGRLRISVGHGSNQAFVRLDLDAPSTQRSGGPQVRPVSDDRLAAEYSWLGAASVSPPPKPARRGPRAGGLLQQFRRSDTRSTVVYLVLVGLAFVAAVAVGRTVDRLFISAAIALIFIVVAIIAGMIVFRPPALR
ncbi:MAG: hypothetical protein RI544_02310 [Haloquadratum sp.]|nr:hypothetical protein [Haloferacaceae archaeon]MDR9444975.1 hypothetical protein [Haloquadratum sp.]